MTDDELARVTAERDAAVAALARVEAVVSSGKNSWWHTGGTRCTPVGPIRDALRGPGAPSSTVAEQLVNQYREAVRSERAASEVTDDDLREAIGRAKKAAETRAGDS